MPTAEETFLATAQKLGLAFRSESQNAIEDLARSLTRLDQDIAGLRSLISAGSVTQDGLASLTARLGILENQKSSTPALEKQLATKQFLADPTYATHRLAVREKLLLDLQAHLSPLLVKAIEYELAGATQATGRV